MDEFHQIAYFKPDDKVVHKQNNINFLNNRVRTTPKSSSSWEVLKKSCLFSIIIQSINVIHSKSAIDCKSIHVRVWNNSNMKFPLFVFLIQNMPFYFFVLNSSCVCFHLIFIPDQKFLLSLKNLNICIHGYWINSFS